MTTLNYILGFIIVAILAVLLYANVILPFQNAKAYIEMELSRAFNDWKRQLRNLYVECIPIIGRYLVDTDE